MPRRCSYAPRGGAIISRMSPRSRPSPDELRAAYSVANLLSDESGEPVTVEPWDIPPHQGRHDFWLHTGTGKVALEVTTLADEADITNRMHWHKRGPGFDLNVPGLASAWTVMIDSSFNANGLVKGIATWLTSLQTEGITSTSKWDGMRPYQHPVVSAMVRGGMVQAEAVPGPPAGLVSFGYYTNGKPRPAGDPNHIASALTDILALDRHRKDAAKLATSGASARHLFMWVDLSRFDVVRAFDDGVPTSAPTVDSQITTIWLAIPKGETVELLRWSASAGWRHHSATNEPKEAMVRPST